MLKQALNLITVVSIAISAVMLSPMNAFAGGGMTGRSTVQDNLETQRLYNLERMQRQANDPSAIGTVHSNTQAADPHAMENGYPVSASAATASAGLSDEEIRRNNAALGNWNEWGPSPASGSGNSTAVDARLAQCSKPGVMCDDDGNTLTTNADGTTTLTTPDGGSGKATPADGKTACDSAYSTATSACLLPGVEGMDAGSAAMFTMLLTQQLPSLASQITSIGKNMSQQCQAQADVQKVMTAINGIKGAACATTISTCRETCETETTTAKSAAQAATTRSDSATATKETTKAGKATAHGNKCAAYTTQVMQMMMAAMQNGVQMVANNQCASDLAAFNAAAPTYTPPAITQIGGCEDPNNQTLACYCTRPGNATSAMCAGFTGGGLAGGGTSTTPNGSTVAAPYAQTVPDTGDGNTVDPFANPAKKSGDGKGPGDGGSGAPGGGGLASFGSEGGGSGAGGTPLSAITGTSGGTGSGLGGAGGGGGGGLARNNGAAAGGGSLMDKFNLKRFLPGSKYKTRGIAGMSVKSVDGITGPMGPSLFEKATRQYQEQIQKQSVILDK